MFSAEVRLRKRYEFHYVYRMGCKLVTPHFLLLYCKGTTGQSRLGITVSRKVGNAVIRNRVKRVVREYFRVNRMHLKTNTDLSIIARRGAGETLTKKLWSELDHLFSLRDVG